MLSGLRYKPSYTALAIYSQQVGTKFGMVSFALAIAKVAEVEQGSTPQAPVTPSHPRNPGEV